MPRTTPLRCADLTRRSQDLNYRIEASKDLTKDNIAASVSSNIPRLLEADQLTREKDAGRTLHHLREGRITFQPTYKFKLGTDTYTSKRIPAWCDRVLFASWADQGDGKKGEVELYESAMAFQGSDHKPVSPASFASASMFHADAIFDRAQVTAIVSLPRSDRSKARIAHAAPYAVDPQWRRKLLAGWLADRTVGLVWSLLVLLGAGQDARLGVLNLVLLTLAGSYRQSFPSLW